MLLANCWLVVLPAAAQHAHIYAGVASQIPGAALWFQNAYLWDTNSYGGYTESPACIYLENNRPDLYPGLYHTATTFSALPATIFNAGPSPYAAALGTYIELRFVSLQGPAGGVLTAWNEIDDPVNPAVIFTLPVGTTNGTNQFNLSEGDPFNPDSDPYGHIHGRPFTLNKPGLYTLGLQLVDTSTNGVNGTSMHGPSDITWFYLQAGLYLNDFVRSNDVTIARFGLPGFTDYVFESNSTVTGTNWVAVANITGTTHSELRWVTDTNATTPTRFYRLRKKAN